MSGPAPAGQALASAALSLTGSHFRLHGRDPASGLDCIGVLATALALTGRAAAIPNGYALRCRDASRFAALAAPCGFVAASGPIMAGDALVFHLGPGQFHLAIAATDGDIIHAHAGLCRVVKSPIPIDWILASHWRLNPDN